MKITYMAPEGASMMFLQQPSKYLAVCAHPDRKPWLVDHDGNEIEIEIAHSVSSDVSFAELYGLKQ